MYQSHFSLFTLFCNRYDASLSMDWQSILLPVHPTSIGDCPSCWSDCIGNDTWTSVRNCSASTHSICSSGDAGTNKECRKHFLFNWNDFLGNIWHHWCHDFYLLVQVLQRRSRERRRLWLLLSYFFVNLKSQKSSVSYGSQMEKYLRVYCSVGNLN